MMWVYLYLAVGVVIVATLLFAEEIRRDFLDREYAFANIATAVLLVFAWPLWLFMAWRDIR